MSQMKDSELCEDVENTPQKKKEMMPSYSYYFSDCSSIISSVKCAVSADGELSRSVSPNFGTLSSSTNEINSKNEYTNDSHVLNMNDTMVYESGVPKLDMTMSTVSSANCTFDQEDELASACAENENTMNIQTNDEFIERYPGFSETGMGECYHKFSRWCKRYSGGNIELFRNSQNNRMKTILEENNMYIGDLKSKYFDEFPIKVLYSKGTTLTDNKFDLASLKPGEMIVDRYRIEKIIGTTTFSKVAKAIDMNNEKEICLKIVFPDYFDQALDEIVLLKLLNAKDEGDKMNIVQLYDSFLYSGSLFLVLELLGENLFEATKDYYITSQRDFTNESRPKKWELQDLKNISYDILTSLNFIHNLGIINCDLKPENILLVNTEEKEDKMIKKSKENGGKMDMDNNGGKRDMDKVDVGDKNRSERENMIKLVDFGSSCFIRDKLNTYVQSRSYRAPEVVLGLPYDTQIDMWSFGCILCELYMGRILFPSDNSATLVASMVSLLGVPPVYMLQHKMNSMFIILPNGNIADLNVPKHILSKSPYYNRLDRSSLCCNVSASDSSKCSHVTYNKWDNTTVNMEPTLDDNSSGLDDASEYNLTERDLSKLNSNIFAEKNIKISNYYDNIRYEENYRDDLDCKIKLDIIHNRNGPAKFMRIIQPSTSSIDVMLEVEKNTELGQFADFIKGLLQYDPIDRLTASAALQHPFIQSRERKEVEYMDPEKESNAIKVYIPSELLEKEDKEYNKSVFVGWKAEKNQLFIVNAYEDRKAERLNSVLNSINKGAKLRNITYMKNGLELVKEFKFEKNTDNKERLQIILKDGKTGDRIRNVIVFVYNNKSFDFKATNLYENMNIQDEIVSETSHLNSDVGSCAILCTTLKNYIDKHMDSVKVELKEEMSLSYMSSYDRRTDVVALCKYYSYQFLMKMTFYLSMMALYTLRVLKCATKFIKFMENKLNFVSIIMSKLRTISLWHKLYEELVNKKEIGEYIAVSTELNDVAVSFYLDLFLGIIYLVWFREVFMEKLFVLRSYLKTKYIEKLKSLFYISTAKVFIHIKLNNEVSTSLSKFIINKVIMWNYVSTYLRPVNVFLFKGMHFMSIFGVSALLSFILDVFTFETRHLYYLYFVILALMNYCHKYLYSLIQMFKGKKWNTLKSELDTNQFTKEHLFIGVVFFIVFTLNYPTIWIFYISIITILMPVLVTKALMDAFIDVVYDFPYYFIIHNTFNSVKYTKGVYFKHMYKSSEEVNKDGTLDYLYLEVMPNKIPLRERNSRIRKKLGEKLDRVSPIKVISKKEGIFLSLNCIDIKMRFMYADDLHSHLRQGEMMKKVVKYVRRGGCNRVLVMPNTMPEITSCSQALEYRNELMELEPKVDYLMTLYLSDKVSTDDLRNNAKSCHVQGVNK
ncbi:serine/threonine protein kinase [Theileria orientalis]|uniref:Serine/threonine protein kinase n=1 Tax=Theileria orientalis TaxID=68886 RepID=A0A976QVY5_THEOR|nr:serine/threonine protein kinase [Theileria orientalis]